MTFPTETAAKEAETETSKTITDGLQHVTQDKNVVQVYQIGTAGEKINTYIQSAKATKNVLKITMFTDLLEDTEYSVEYKEYDPAVFKAVKWIPAELKNDYSYIPSNEQEGGTATLNYYVYTVEGVDITNKVKGDSGIVYEDCDKNNTYDKYAVLDNRVDFYKNNVQADVFAKYTYWRDGKETPLDNKFTVYAKDTRRYAIDYYLLGNPNSAFDIDKKREAKISVDEGVKTLNVRIAVDLNGDGVYGDDVTGDGKVDGADFFYTNDSNVTFVTSNADKLNVEKESGITYAPKDANEVVNVYVYYKDVLVDADTDSSNGKNPIPVTVYGKKTLKDLKVTLKTDGKYSYSENIIQKYDQNGTVIRTETPRWYDVNVTYPIDEDSEKFEIEAVDQFGATYGNVDIYIQKTTDALDAINSGAVYMNGTQIKKATDVNNISTADLLVNNVGKITPTFTAKSYDNGVKNISFRVTAVDQITKTKVQRNFSFTVKNTTESTVSRLVVDKVNGGTTSFRVLGKDSAGYAVCGYLLDSQNNVKNGSANSRVYLSFANNRSSKDLTDAQTNSNDGSVKRAITINYTENIVGGGLTKLSNDVAIYSTATATGSALTSAKLTNVVRYVQSASGTAISFLPTSSYAVKAWQLNRSGKLAIVDSLSFEYAPNVHKVDFEWRASHSENTEVDNVLNEAFRFSVYEYVDTNNDGQKDTWKIVNYNLKTAKELETAGLEFAISYVKKDNMISFLSFYEKDITGTVISETPINRTVYIGVSK